MRPEHQLCHLNLNEMFPLLIRGIENISMKTPYFTSHNKKKSSLQENYENILMKFKINRTRNTYTKSATNIIYF